VLTETAYQLHQNFILFLSISLFLFLLLPLPLLSILIFLCIVLLDTSTTSVSVSVCNSETIGDYPVLHALIVHAAFAETVDSLHKLWRELLWRVQCWPIIKLTCRWLWMWCGNFKYPVCVHTLKNISVRPPPFPNTTVVCATSYLQHIATLHTDAAIYMMQ